MNVLILRMHEHKRGIVAGRSECPKCHHTLSSKDLIPLLSFLLLRGKCRYCRTKISWQYVGMELVTGFLWFTITYALLPFYSLELLPAYFFFLFFANLLLVIAIYDIRYLEIPNKLTFPFMLVLIICSFLNFTPTLLNGLYGALSVFGFFYLQILIPYFLYSLRKKKWELFKSVLLLPFWFLMQIISPHKWFCREDDDDESPSDLVEWIGFGDLRIAVMMGFILGLKFSILALFISYFIGAIIGVFVILKERKRRKMIPFGPFLVLGTFITLFYGQIILNAYLKFGEVLRSVIL